MMKKRILFLISDTGGGHRTAAQAIEEAIHYRYPHRYQTHLEDMLSHHSPWPVNQIPRSYGWLTGPGLLLWKLMWQSSSWFQTHKLVVPSLSPIIEQRALHYLRQFEPDLLVSMHPLMNHLACQWRCKLNLNIPLVTVVTDMVTVHPLWICPGVTRCLVPTQAAAHSAVEQGISPDKVEICGQPVRLKFGAVAGSKSEIRGKLGLAQNRRTILVTGGGEGFGPVLEIAQAIDRQARGGQLLVVAGRNQALQKRLQAAAWENPTHIYGFVNTMPELMRAADILVTKAGPGTLSEAFVTGLPPLISGYIPGQEQGNVAYVQQHQAGIYVENPQEIGRLVARWMNPADASLQQMAQNAARLAQPDSSLKIAARLCSLT